MQERADIIKAATQQKMQTSMASFNEFAEKHPSVGMFDIPSETLASYLSSLGSSETSNDGSDERSAIKSTNDQGLTCRACGLTFSSRKEQGDHFRSDAHRSRLRRMLEWEGGMEKNLERVEEDEDGDCGGYMPLLACHCVRKNDFMIVML